MTMLKRFLLLWALALTLVPFSAIAEDRLPDPTGAITGTIADVTAAKAGEPTLTEVAAQVGHNKISINFIWTLLTGFLVMFMSAGFALLETGFTRAKNASHTIAMNLLIYPVCVLGFYLCGFAIMFG